MSSQFEIVANSLRRYAEERYPEFASNIIVQVGYTDSNSYYKIRASVTYENQRVICSFNFDSFEAGEISYEAIFSQINFIPEPVLVPWFELNELFQGVQAAESFKFVTDHLKND